MKSIARLILVASVAFPLAAAAAPLSEASHYRQRIITDEAETRAPADREIMVAGRIEAVSLERGLVLRG